MYSSFSRFLLALYTLKSFQGSVNGKGGPVESRPIVKSEFRQIPPNRLQLLDRIALTWSSCLSTIGQSTVMECRCPIRASGTLAGGIPFAAADRNYEASCSEFVPSFCLRRADRSSYMFTFWQRLRASSHTGANHCDKGRDHELNRGSLSLRQNIKDVDFF